jgi:two-component system, chemotaxis family, chemotaxis protein CheY
MKILVVDDDPVSRCMLRQVLASTEPGCEVAEAACGVDACRFLERSEHGFDAVFLDISMPDFDGLELLQRFRARPALRNLPIILCTSANDRATVVKAAAAGARHYIVKPPAPSIVAEKLAQVRAGTAVGPAAGTKTPFAAAT